jgi:hypothetical protein
MFEGDDSFEDYGFEEKELVLSRPSPKEREANHTKNKINVLFIPRGIFFNGFLC